MLCREVIQLLPITPVILFVLSILIIYYFQLNDFFDLGVRNIIFVGMLKERMGFL